MTKTMIRAFLCFAALSLFWATMAGAASEAVEANAAAVDAAVVDAVDAELFALNESNESGSCGAAPMLDLGTEFEPSLLFGLNCGTCSSNPCSGASYYSICGTGPPAVGGFKYCISPLSTTCTDASAPSLNCVCTHQPHY